VGAISLDLMAAVIMTSLFRQAIPANVWRGVHWLAYLSWPLAVAHSVGVGSDIRFGWADIVVAFCIIAVLAALGWRIWQRPRRHGARTALPRPARPEAQLASSGRLVTSSRRSARP
jgi:sulfoxide reductase heme-binding subunit YedZ